MRPHHPYLQATTPPVQASGARGFACRGRHSGGTEVLVPRQEAVEGRVRSLCPSRTGPARRSWRRGGWPAWSESNLPAALRRIKSMSTPGMRQTHSALGLPRGQDQELNRLPDHAARVDHRAFETARDRLAAPACGLMKKAVHDPALPEEVAREESIRLACYGAAHPRRPPRSPASPPGQPKPGSVRPDPDA
jgi:hypothetical protein